MATWQDIADGNYVGGDLEFENGENITHRGPIKAFNYDGGEDFVTFTLEWVAILVEGVGWTWPDESISPKLSFPSDWALPQDIGQGRMFFGFSIPNVTSVKAYVFPDGGSKLDKRFIANVEREPSSS